MNTATSHDYDLILVDGSSYLYRAFHALPPLTNSHGEATGAVYGVLNMLKKLLHDYPAKYVAVVFDAKGKTQRHHQYPAYKAQRPPMPPELSSQLQALHDTIEAMGLPLLLMEGVEADDIIATLAHSAAQQGLKTLISTGDKDLAQLVNPKIHLINTMSEQFLDENGVKTKFGVTPEQIVDYLALIGDSSDNIPGVPKVGPKTAVKWLQQYGSLDNIIEHAAEIGGKIGENLRANIEQAKTAKELVTLLLEVELGFSPKELTRRPQNNEKLIEIFQRLEFKKWLAEILQSVPQTKATTKYETILDLKAFEMWVDKLKNSSQFAVDTETTSIDPMAAELVGISVAITPHEAAYIPLIHDYAGAPPQLSRELVLKKLQPLLEDPTKPKLGQNLKYDFKIFKHYGIELQGIAFDTMLEAYVLDATGSRRDLDTLALKYLGTNTIHFEDVAGSGKNQLTFNQVALEEATPYAAEDADIVLQLHEKLWPQLTEEKNLAQVFTTIEMPLVPILANIEYNGVNIDSKLLTNQSRELEQRIEKLQHQAYKYAKHEFNLSSPKQLQEILYEELKLPVLKKTPKGQPSTAETVLQELALDFPLPQVILEYRSLAKLKSTYTDALPQQINPKTGRIHTSYNQAVTATGRLSSTNPNLQNIPTRTPEGREIRKAFTAPAGTKIIAADYSQIELRIMAHLSQDSGLLTAFANNEDIHRATAAEIFAITTKQVSSEQRRQAKAINFGLIYGMSAFGLSQQLRISRQDAQKYINIYFERYPLVKHYMDEIREKAYRQGYVETLFGRRLYVPEIKSSNLQRRNAAERAAINAPMQGTAADIIKLAMIKVANWIQESRLDIKMIMQVHDELVFEAHSTIVDKAIPLIKQYMTGAVALAIPLEVNIGVGANWDEAH